jgi:short-subunit dehydrogenase
MNWSRRSAWIIGASTGIGAALAKELANAGCQVTITARNEEVLNQVSQLRMSVKPADINNAEALGAIANELSAAGRLDLVVVAAGYWKRDDPLEFNAEEFRRHVETNLLGLSNVLESVIPPMKKANKGHVVVLSSVAGYRGMPGSLGYGATKAAQINLFEALRATFNKTGITFQTVSPGFVETPMTSTNTFPMPFLISSEEAAKHILRGLESSKPEIVFPWQMAVAMKIAKFIPQRLWVKLLGRNA